jgi:TrpR-related protein YerC/YecD
VLAYYYVTTLPQYSEEPAPVGDDWKNDDAQQLIDAILSLKDRAEAERFLRDLLTLNELRDLTLRWTVARLLDQGLHYAEISQRTGASTATITRIASWLNHGEGGYRLVLDRLRESGSLPYPAGSVEH